jgi:hypothetical protein
LPFWSFWSCLKKKNMRVACSVTALATRKNLVGDPSRTVAGRRHHHFSDCFKRRRTLDVFQGRGCQDAGNGRGNVWQSFQVSTCTVCLDSDWKLGNWVMWAGQPHHLGMLYTQVMTWGWAMAFGLPNTRLNEQRQRRKPQLQQLQKRRWSSAIVDIYISSPVGLFIH